MHSIHYMKLQPKPFAKIKEGTKTLELRLNDEKRQSITVGDTIIFSLMSSQEEADTVC